MKKNYQPVKKYPDLRNKTIVVTGASSGVGKAIAIQMAKHGAGVVLAARREKALEETAAECEEAGGKALVVATDVTDSNAVILLAAKANAWGGNINAWINNAGLLGAGAFDEIPVRVNQKIIETNLMGYVNGAHAVLPYFKKQGYGTLVNNISVGGWFPVPYAAAYSASKFGITGFSQSLKGELSHWPGIHICEVFPAFLDTPGIQHAANYTGRVLKAAPPVYDPQKVARAIVRLIQHPKPSTMVGGIAPLFKIGHVIFPILSRRITGGVIRMYLKKADAIANTPGNVLETVEYGTSIHGDYGAPSKHKKKAVAGMLLLAGVGIGVALLSKRNKQALNRSQTV